MCINQSTDVRLKLCFLTSVWGVFLLGGISKQFSYFLFNLIILLNLLFPYFCMLTVLDSCGEGCLKQALPLNVELKACVLSPLK